jgi:phosphatidylglycerophosphatase A
MLLRRIGVFIATCAYIGYAPVAPGTFGSAAGLALFYLLRHGRAMTIDPVPEAVAIAALLAAGVWAASEAERHFGRTDPGAVVIDEVIGMLVTLAFVPVSLTGAIVGFFVFRILDIVKPWPARQFEQLHGGFGIVLDDVMAGIYGNLVMWGLVYLLPAWLR